MCTLIYSFISDSFPDTCDQCENGSTCLMVTQTNESTYTCQCLHGWVGSTCSMRLSLSAVNVTMETVSLAINVDSVAATSPLKGSGMLDSHTPSVSETHLINDTKNLSKSQRNTYHNSSILTQATRTSITVSVHCWPKQRPDVCNMIPNVTNYILTVFGLQSDTEYTFCVYGEQLDLCIPRSNQNLTDKHNCLQVRTRTPNPVEDRLILYTIILSSISVVFLICLIVIIIVSVKQRIFHQLICFKIRRKRTRREVISPIQMANLDTDNQTVELTNLHFDSTPETTLLNSPACSRVQINPPRSPGKPKHQLVTERTRGYAVFSAKNEQTIPLSAVLEYDEDTLRLEESVS